MSTNDGDHSAPGRAPLAAAQPAPALPDTSPNLALMLAMRRRRRIHHSAWRSR
jgi:hypothetical protein